jgi:hypothetical protein
MQSSGRRRAAIAALVGAVVLVGTVGFVVSRPDGDPGETSLAGGARRDDAGASSRSGSGSGSSGSGTSDAVPAPGGGTTKQKIRAGRDGKVVKAGLRPSVRLPEGIVVARSALDRRVVKAGGPGEVAGPAVVVRVRLTNDSSRTIDLNTVMVRLLQRDGQVPLPVTADPYTPFVGTLGPGESRTGSYVYSTTRSRNKSWVIVVQYIAGSAIARFDVRG